MPDDDDLQPLTDFNEKSLLTKYADNTYGCVVLVRQPFRSAHLLYKNALQKMTEVRTWTECLVKLVDGEESSEKTTTSSTFSRKMVSKKLIFFNLHELVTLSTELEISLEQVINEHTQNQVSTPIKSLEAKEEEAANALNKENNVNEVTFNTFF